MSRQILLLFLCWFSFNVSAATVFIKSDPEQDPGVNDADRINQAIQQIHAAGGGTVLLSGGTFNVSTPVTIWANVMLKGQGHNTRIRLVDNAPSFAGMAGILRFANDVTGERVMHAGVEDLLVDGNREQQLQDVGDAEKKYGLYAEGDYISIRRVKIVNCMGYGFDPHGEILSNGDFRASTHITMEDNVSINNLLDGFTLDRLEESVFIGNVARNNGRHGLNIVSDARNILIKNNDLRKNTVNGITVQNGSADLQIVANKVRGNLEAGIMLRQSDNNIITDNVIRGNGFQAIRLRGSSDNQVLGNFTRNNSKKLKHSYFEIRLEAFNTVPSLRNSITQNILFSPRSKGIVYEKDNSDLNHITSNDYRNNQPPFVLVGVGSTESDNNPIL